MERFRFIKTREMEYSIFHNTLKRNIGRVVIDAYGDMLYIKDVNLVHHKGEAQYLILYKKVCSNKELIDYLETKYRIRKYIVKFVGKNFVGFVIYPWEYYVKNREVYQFPGYEPQYCIDLPEDIFTLNLLESNKNFVIDIELKKIIYPKTPPNL